MAELSLEPLARSIEAHDWLACAERTFELYFRLPAETGRQVTGDTIARYAAIFRHSHPGVTWPSQLLDSPPQWLTDHGRQTSDPPAGAGIAAQGWLTCLDALLLGSSTTNVLVRTAAWATGTATAINSRALAVWEADDPEAVDLWLAGRADPLRTYDHNAAARAVLHREWWWAHSLLSLASAQAEPAGEDEEIAAGLARWRANEHQLIVEDLNP